MRYKKGTVLCVGNFNSNTGYAWRLIESLWIEVKAISQAREYNTLVCYPQVTDINPDLNKHNISISEHNFSIGGLINRLKTARFIHKNRVSVLYLTDKPSVCLSYLLFRLAGVKKIIVHDHTPGYRRPLGKLRLSIKQILNRTPWISCDVVLGVSPYVCKRLYEVNGVSKRKIEQVLNGLKDTQHFKKRVEQSEDLTIRLITVARANYYKGVDFALKVMRSLVHDKGINAYYSLIGDGPDLEAFKQLSIALNISDRVDFLGQQDNVAERLPAFDVAFHPSNGEAMCLAIVEYLRAGVPVVCSTNSSVNSILVNNEDSYFFEEHDIEAAARQLQRLVIKHEERQKMGIAARQNFLHKYQERQMIDSFSRALSKYIL